MRLASASSLLARCRQDILPLLALALFFCAYYSDFLFGTKTFVYGADNTYLLSPTFAKISSLIWRGEWPTHVDTAMGGLEFYNSAQFSIYYPLYPFYFNKLVSGLQAASTLNLFTLLHIFLGSGSCYILARTLSCHPWGALFAGITFCAADNTRVYASWINITSPYSWVPLLICGIIQIHRQRFNLGYILTTISCTLIILASPSQPMIHSLFLVGCAIFYWLIMYAWNREPATLRSSLFACLSMTTVLLLCAPVIIPTGLEMKHMIRWLGPFGSVIGTKPLSFESFLLDEAPLREWTRIFIAGPSSSVVGSSFIGLIPGTLTVGSLILIRRNRVLIALGCLALYGLLSAFGTHSGMAYINYQIPLINKIREPSRHLVLFVFGASVLAAVAISWLQQSIPKWAFVGMVAVGILGHFIQMRATLQGYPHLSQTDVASIPNQESMAALAHIQSTAPRSFIKAIETEPASMFFGMNSFYFDDSMKTVDGYYNPQRYSNHRRILYLTPTHEDLMKLSGVTHLICGDCPPSQSETGDVKIASYTIRELNAVKYPTLYPEVSTRDNPFILTHEDGDNTPAAFDGLTVKKLLARPQNPDAIITTIDTNNYKQFTVAAKTSSLFIADNLFSSNWNYLVNGREVKSFPVNFMRQGIILSRGKKIVEMHYSPRYMRGLLLATFLGAFIFLVVLSLCRTRPTST